jgi:hypothetical protein
MLAANCGGPMADRIDYGGLMSRAMRGLVADVLRQVAEEGLPGSHHFFISFATGHPGVDMPRHLREHYPEDMTIVIQNWFENLAVSDDRFSVTLSFGGNPETLVIPFEAMKTFVDPSIEFGLRFDAHDSAESAEVVPLPEPETDPEPDPEGDPDGTPPAGGEGKGEVVSLDRFRRK